MVDGFLVSFVIILSRRIPFPLKFVKVPFFYILVLKVNVSLTKHSAAASVQTVRSVTVPVAPSFSSAERAAKRKEVGNYSLIFNKFCFRPCPVLLV